MIVEKLDWDSSFFGYEVGNIILTEDYLFDKTDFIRSTSKFKLVYLFSKKLIDFDSISLVDDKIVLSRDLSYFEINEKRNTVVIQTFNSKIHSVEEIQKLSLESGIYSRFYLDKNFKDNEYEKLYLSWINQSIGGRLAFAVLVAVNENKTILGFITINKKKEFIAEIGLIAVSNESRGKGVAKNLLKKSFEVVNELGYKKIQVVTQKNNLPAMNLYKSEGFKIIERTYVYHYWNL